GEWVHIEAYVKKSHLPNGRLTVWLNGQEIIDAQNIQTLRNEGDRLHWSLNNYTDNITPSDPVIYADDAVISTRRVGAN
ncbi:MAG: hypothetical protein GY797_23280, partial [Deltaproteobacteria bacterium]|nr:hypothetical protein [Deltaproteobacteria bacterium]